MPAYVDVAAVRIQHYIARTPKLRLRRAASWMLTHATEESTITTWVEGLGLPGVRLNGEAGHADGVVSLVVPAGHERRVAERLLTYLRSRLPAAELQAVWGTADTYLQAYPALTAQRHDPLTALPSTADFPLAETCGECRVSVRVGERCTDCQAREDVRGWRVGPPGAGDDALGVERWVLDQVTMVCALPLTTVEDLGDLARLGAPKAPGGRENRASREGQGNHLATIAVDGNGMGGFFAALAGGQDTDLKRRISPEIAQATRRALVNAVAAVVSAGDTSLPAIPHVLGGDDVVVSVTAERAWPFVTRFLSEFDAAMAEAADRLALPGHVRQRVPTMSAGVVFAHHAFPYARAVGLAEQALRRAKRDTCGAEPSIAWLDVTTDGEELPDWRRTFPTTRLRELHEPLADLADLAAIGKTGRQTLARLLARGGELEARAAALLWARRAGHTCLRGPLQELEINEMRTLVALTRWWRP